MDETTMYVQEFPLENDVYLLNDDGTPTPRVNRLRLENSQYWESKHRMIGVVMLISMFTLLFMILGESNILQGIWSYLLPIFGGIIHSLFVLTGASK